MSERMNEGKWRLKSTVTRGGLKSPVFNKGKKNGYSPHYEYISVKKTIHMNLSYIML